MLYKLIKNSLFKLNLTFFLIVFLTIPAFANTNGYLFIIGGGKRPDYLIEKFISLSGGQNAKILIIPIASSVPFEAGKYIREQFTNNGSKNVDYLIFDKKNVDSDENLSRLSNASGIFFGGGDQNKLTEVMLGSKFLKKIKNIYKKGGVIGGTSAGSAVMSKIMITGDELKNEDKDNPFISIKKENIKISEGFGFVDDSIIDQHFVKRKRQNRLISVILENPDLTGIGIDESTAIIVESNTFEVLGESNVIVYNTKKSKSIRTNKNGNFGVNEIILQILVSGDKYNLRSNKIISD